MGFYEHVRIILEGTRLGEVHGLNESFEVKIDDRLKKFLTYFLNIKFLQRDKFRQKQGFNPHQVVATNFHRLFKFEPTRDKNKFYGNFYLDLQEPYLKYFTQEEKQAIRNIVGFNDITRFFNIHAKTGKDDIDKLRVDQLMDAIDEEDRMEDGTKILAIIFNALARTYSEFGHKGWENYLFETNLKPETQKHFGGMFSELLESFHNYTPTVQEVQSFKLTPKEQKIVDILVNAAKVKKGYNVNTELVNYLENTGGLYQVIKDLFLKYISQIAGRFNFDEEGEDYNEDHAIKNMVRSEIMQPYMNSDVLFNLIYNNPDIDVNDLEGLLSTGVRRRGQEAKEYVGQNTSGKINTTLYLFMFYDHKPDTVRKVAEIFVKYAILANFKNTDYMFERSLKPATQKHFGGIIGNL